MAEVVASPRRTSEYTQVHACAKCKRAFWGKRSWHRVTVICPHCKYRN